jgi:hypothetical protein
MKTPYNNSSMGMKLLYLTTAVYVKQRKTTKSRAIKLRMFKLLHSTKFEPHEPEHLFLCGHRIHLWEKKFSSI